MKKQNLPDIDLVLYHDDVPVGIFKPDYMGMLGLQIKNCSQLFENGTPLEIEVLGPEKTCVDDNRISVSVTSISDDGLGLRLEHHSAEHIERWSSILSDIFSFSKNDKYYLEADAA
ncbi:MAG: hypothetical protein OEY11_04800 [Gammaproteobacteria bacterium]|nr:hypothetical protein [Gammaproteobacteria bacterium]